MKSALEDPSLLKKEAARRFLLNFTSYTFPEYEVNWHHAHLCQTLDRFVRGDIDRLMVFMPPRHGKSELVSRRLPALIMGQRPDTKIIAISYNTALATRMSRDTQRIMESREYAELFPDTVLPPRGNRLGWIRQDELWEIIDKRGSYRAGGILSGVTGMGADYLIIDDPIKNQQEADSPSYRKRVWEEYLSSLTTRLEGRGKILLTLTRWHEDDLAGRLLDLAQSDPGADQWAIVNFPAIREPGDPATEEDLRPVGDPLWPGKMPLSELTKRKKALGSRKWNSLYQQSPSPSEGGIWKRHWWRFYDHPPALTDFQEIIQSWDLSFKDTKAGSYVVGQIWGRIGPRKYLLEQVRDRMDFTTTLTAIRGMSARWPTARAKIVEDKANGPAVISTLANEISGIIPFTPQGSKESRAIAVSPTIEAGDVFLPRPSEAPWVESFIEEGAIFPNGTSDDQVDCATQALLRFGHSRLLLIGRAA